MTDVRQIFEDAPLCEVCHTHQRDAHRRLTHFRDGRYATVIRCRDSYACRETVEAAGGTWELLDSTAPPFPEVKVGAA